MQSAPDTRSGALFNGLVYSALTMKALPTTAPSR